MRKTIKNLGLLIATPFFVILLYLLAALLGGVIPSNITQGAVAADDEPARTIYLSANALHADIAIPVDSLTRDKFAFLRRGGFPLNNSKLQYLVVGWGSREFYTSTAEYSDMAFGTIWRAVTGDASVMHVAPAGDISKSEGVVAIKISQERLEKLVAFMLSTFSSDDGQPQILTGATFGYGDLFYEAKGRFNIFNPCNVWVSKALRAGGLSTGIWTPTTYSLMLHNKLYH